MAKMTKQTRKMVEEVNEHLRYNHIKDFGDPTFSTMCWLLSRSGCYAGFNLFTVDGRIACGENSKEFDHLEIYIK